MSNNVELLKISDKEYFSRDEVSNSDLNQLAISPRAYKHYKEHGGMVSTPQMRLGSLVHAMYLEPEIVTEQFFLSEKVDGRTKKGKEAKARALEAEAKGLTVVNEEEWEKAQTIITSLKNNLGFLENGDAEMTAVWEMFGVKCRGKIDWLYKDGKIHDLKTTQSLKYFEKSVGNFGYHRQAAFYGRAMKQLFGKFKGFTLRVVETTGSFDSADIDIDVEALRVGDKEVRYLLDKLKCCQDTDSWPGIYTPDKVNTVGLPRWYQALYN